ncbi:MAG: hypothetical protein JXM72_10500 [Deltaproteobacteria bacterium]|nr:hypothetical protein [Deltaproteobacteria bacterium]
MKECPECKVWNQDDEESCTACGASLGSVESVSLKEGESPVPETNDVVENMFSDKNKPSISYSEKYKTARMIGQLVSGVGWVAVAICAIAFLMALVNSMDHHRSIAPAFLVLSGVVPGLSMVLLGQITQAIVDSADHLKEMLEIIKSKNKTGFTM